MSKSIYIFISKICQNDPENHPSNHSSKMLQQNLEPENYRKLIQKIWSPKAANPSDCQAPGCQLCETGADPTVCEPVAHLETRETWRNRIKTYQNNSKYKRNIGSTVWICLPCSICFLDMKPMNESGFLNGALAGREIR